MMNVCSIQTSVNGEPKTKWQVNKQRHEVRRKLISPSVRWISFYSFPTAHNSKHEGYSHWKLRGPTFGRPVPGHTSRPLGRVSEGAHRPVHPEGCPRTCQKRRSWDTHLIQGQTLQILIKKTQSFNFLHYITLRSAIRD